MHAPVDEQLRVATRYAAQPGNAASHMTGQTPVFSPPPVRQFSVYLKEDSIHGAYSAQRERGFHAIVNAR
jgi:hypothetical protein